MVNTPPVRPQRDPVARAVLLVCFGAALYLGVTQPGITAPAAAQPDRIILIATPTIPAAPFAPAYNAPVTSQEAPRATEAPPLDTSHAEIVSAPPVAPVEEPPIAVDQAPIVEAAPIVIPEELIAPTQPPPAPEEDQHGTKAAPDRAAHYAAATNDYQDLPTIECPCGNPEPNHHPMPKGAGSR